MANHVFRCRSCGDFFREDKVAQAKCEGCDFATVRCKKCGGMRGAVRSIRAHVRWFFHFGRFHSNVRVRIPHLKIMKGGLEDLDHDVNRRLAANSRR